MKNINIALLSIMLTLTGVTAYAMEHTNKTQIQYACSLGKPYACLRYAYTDTLHEVNALHQDIYVNSIPAGHIIYSDSYKNGCLHRYIHDFFIHQNMQRQRIGTQSMLQFIEQSQQEGIHALELQCFEHLLGFYGALGFQETSCDFIFTNMIRTLKSKENVLPVQAPTNSSI